MTGHSYGGIYTHRITDQKRYNTYHVRTTASIYIPKHRNSHHSLPLDWRRKQKQLQQHPCSSKMPSNSGQQTKFTQDGYVYWCNKRIRTRWPNEHHHKVRWSIHTDDQYVLDKLSWAISRLNMKNLNWKLMGHQLRGCLYFVAIYLFFTLYRVKQNWHDNVPRRN
jgi:hypothetical protein